MTDAVSPPGPLTGPAEIAYVLHTLIEAVTLRDEQMAVSLHDAVNRSLVAVEGQALTLPSSLVDSVDNPGDNSPTGGQS